MKILINDRLMNDDGLPAKKFLPPYAMEAASEIAKRLSFLFQAYDIHHLIQDLEIGFKGSQTDPEMFLKVRFLPESTNKPIQTFILGAKKSYAEARHAGRFATQVVKDVLGSMISIISFVHGIHISSPEILDLMYACEK